MTIPIFVIVGATGIGKSDFAVNLAKKEGAEIVNADAMQLYKGMNIGTAKITTEQMQGILHYQLDVIDVTKEASVAIYQKKARDDIEKIKLKNKPVVVVGGSGLYIRALIDNIVFPPTCPKIRKKYEQELLEKGSYELWDLLNEKDKTAAKNIDKRNGKRLVRALEAIELTNKPFSTLMPKRDYFYKNINQIGLKPSNMEKFDQNLNSRAKKIFQHGIIDELEQLEKQAKIDSGADSALSKTAKTAIGYRQALSVLQGTIDTKTAIEQTALATRQLARRQIKWFRKDPRIAWIEK